MFNNQQWITWNATATADDALYNTAFTGFNGGKYILHFILPIKRYVDAEIDQNKR